MEGTRVNDRPSIGNMISNFLGDGSIPFNGNNMEEKNIGVDNKFPLQIEALVISMIFKRKNTNNTQHTHFLNLSNKKITITITTPNQKQKRGIRNFEQTTLASISTPKTKGEERKERKIKKRKQALTLFSLVGGVTCGSGQKNSGVNQEVTAGGRRGLRG